MRRILPLNASMRAVGTAAILALATAVVGPALGIAQDLTGPLAPPAAAAGPWTCEEPPVSGPPAPAVDFATIRFMAAMLLSAQETALGIRTDQMDAWRGYTTALIALLPSGERLDGWADKKKGGEAQAFDLAQDLANAAIARGEKARVLAQAISKLRAALTPEQMSMARQMQERLVERIVSVIAWRRGIGRDIPL